MVQIGRTDLRYNVIENCAHILRGSCQYASILYNYPFCFIELFFNGYVFIFVESGEGVAG